MLILKDLNKFYRSKHAEKVQALKDINLEFGSKGFIVLLGKSGSGKSTLLNILGGLDNFDSGEIIVKNTSTANFHSNDWDSYRNTYVGFVFQEFYIIEEFSVGKNISLALELQGFPKEKIAERVVEILEQVDLAGYKDRRPNEISGGQKQRIAIARALVKDPQIILADEPTGNLDSETGRLILETLKKLSETKLVIMVTHDADFASEFGDRIIELKDGEVINDKVNYNHHISKEEVYTDVSEEIESIIKLPKGRQLTQNMINYINQRLVDEDKNLYISLTHDTEYMKTFAPNIDKEKDQQTNELELDNFLKDEANDAFALKKSSLPFSYALKLAVSSLFTKKLRLIFMTFLFILSLIFVGMATNFSFYNADTSAALTFKKSNITIIPINKQTKFCDDNYCYMQDTSATDEDITGLKSKYPDIQFLKTIDSQIQLNDLVNITSNYDGNQYYSYGFSKITILDNNQTPFEVTGNYPTQANEIMITDYMAEMLVHFQAFSDATKIEDVLNQHLNFKNQDLIISGIVKTNYEQFSDIKDWNNVGRMPQDFSTFYQLQTTIFQQMFMKQDTYDALFSTNYFSFDVTNNNENNNYGYRIVGSPVNDQLSDNLIGDLPQQKNEIVVTLNILANLYQTDFFSMTNDELISFISDKTISFTFNTYNKYPNQTSNRDYKIVGIINNTESKNIDFDVMFNNSELADLQTYALDNTATVSVTSILGNNQSENTKFINDLPQLNYIHNTQYSPMLNELKSLTTGARTTLYIIGAVFSVFTSFLIFTFISSSVSNKQKEIGTLRAIGARGIDVSKIFIIEGLIIGLFASIISNIATGFLISWANHSITSEFKVNLVLLYINPLSILCVFVLAIIVIIISTFIPLKRITLMKPIKAIKNIK